MKAVLVVLATVAVGLVCADYRIHASNHAKRWENLHRTEMSLRKAGMTIDPKTLPTPMWYSQTLDHFDATNPTRWQQQYIVNDQYFKGGDSPVFLMIEGEGAMSPYDAVAGEMVELAQTYGALVICVEHRYYGASVPVPDLSTPNMKYLSSQQALSDLAEFIGFAQTQFGLSAANPWFAFGGSYAGAMTSWIRLKFPDLIYGAISSSGPVNAILNFEAYNDVVDMSLAATLVGGSAQCVQNIQQAFTEVASLAASGASGLSQLSQTFMNCPNGNLANSYDYYQFISNLAGNFQEAVQYNGDVPVNISVICQVMTQSQFDPLTNLAQVNNMTAAMSPGGCVDNSWNDYIVSLSNTTVNKNAGGVGLRQWTWQTCAEFGYYQTCDATTQCPFESPEINIASFTNLCQQIFGITAATTQQKIDFTNLYYGSNKPGGSRIVFVNGLVDPWHALSVLQNLGNNMTAIVIPGTSHCQNMDGTRPSDTPAMTQARQQISAQLGQWIAQAAEERKMAQLF